MQIVKNKHKKKPWLRLLAAILLMLTGVAFIILNSVLIDAILVIAVAVVLIGYATYKLVICWKANDFTRGAVSIVTCYTFGFFLIGFNYQITNVSVLPSIIVGVFSFVIGLLRLLICVNCIHNRIKGAVRNGISAVLCIGFALFLLIHPIKNFDMLTAVAGCYLIFYGITLLGDYIADVTGKDLDENKVDRRLHFALPNLYTAVQPAQMIKKINKGREEGEIVGGMLIEQKNNAKFDTVNVEILVHLTTQGANKFGHVDLAVKDKVYSYGTYDSSKDKLMGFVSQGTFIIVPKIPYLKHCLDYQKKYVIGFGAYLSEKQLQNLMNNIEELLSHCEPFESLYEQAVKNGEDGSELKDPASNIVRDVGGKVYTVVSGMFRRYFGINTNCVKVADWLLTDSGIDRLSFSAISTPGGYYSMLDNMFRRDNTRIIRKTSYIIADEIDDLEELRELARQTAMEMKQVKAVSDKTE